MKQFNYYDYLEYKKLKRLEEIKAPTMLKEESAPYYYRTEEEAKKEYEPEKINHPQDKLFRLALDNKKEVAELINRELKIKSKYKLTENYIEKYNSSFISQKFRNQEADVVYKKKDQKIFFLIEHQSKIDYDMPRRILHYEIEIIESAIDHKKIKKDEKIPTVIPIVIYTGTAKWNAKKYFKECQEILKGAERVGLGNYYIIDTNN